MADQFLPQLRSAGAPVLAELCEQCAIEFGVLLRLGCVRVELFDSVGLFDSRSSAGHDPLLDERRPGRADEPREGVNTTTSRASREVGKLALSCRSGNPADLPAPLACPVALRPQISLGLPLTEAL